MAIEKRVYKESELVELDRASAPSIDLKALRVEKYCEPKDGGNLKVFYANVRSSWKPNEECPDCHGTAFVRCGNTGKPRRVRDVPRGFYSVQIILQSPRIQCKACGARINPKIDGIVKNGSMTERLKEYIRNECFIQPHTDLSERTGLSVQTIQNIMDEEIEEMEKERRDNPPAAPRVLGVDEKHITRKMRGILVDIETGKLLEMTEANDKEHMKKAITSLKDWDKNIKVVTTDMANSYLRWMPDLLPQATFVIDKFHVIQDINRKITATKTGLYKYRKKVISKIDDVEERERQTKILKICNSNKRLFNYSTEKLARDKTGKAEKLATVVEVFPEFYLLRNLYFLIEHMYTMNTRADAEKVWNEWQELLPPSTKNEYNEWCKKHEIPKELFTEFQSFSRSGFTFFKPYILNYFNPGCRFTNAAAEGLNNLIGTINSAGNGLRFKHLRAKALYKSLIRKRTRYDVDISNVQKWKPTYTYTAIGTNSGEVQIIKKKRFKTAIEELDFPPLNIYADNSWFAEPAEERLEEAFPDFDGKATPFEYGKKKTLRDFIEADE